VGRIQLAQDRDYEQWKSFVNLSNLQQSYVVHLVRDSIYWIKRESLWLFTYRISRSLAGLRATHAAGFWAKSRTNTPALHVGGWAWSWHSHLLKTQLPRNPGPKTAQSTSEGGKEEESYSPYDYICNNIPILSAINQHQEHKH